MRISANQAQNIILPITDHSGKCKEVSFSSFLKAINENAKMRKQVEDIIDLGLFENQFLRNINLIQSARENSEAKTFELMMQFYSGEDNYIEFREKIHTNRIIRTLAIRDKREQADLIYRVTHL